MSLVFMQEKQVTENHGNLIESVCLVSLILSFGAECRVMTAKEN